MLQHDYILEVIGKFVESVTVALLGVFKKRDFSQIGEAEAAVADLLDLDQETAMSLAPASLVTMMQLSGVGDTVAAYAAWALRKVADAYELSGDATTAGLRRDQARAIGDAFGVDEGEVPPEFAELEGELSD
jgi:hypothetical protein